MRFMKYLNNVLTYLNDVSLTYKVHTMKPQLMFAFILLLPQSGPISSNRSYKHDSDDTSFSLSSCSCYGLFPAVWVGLVVLFKHL